MKLSIQTQDIINDFFENACLIGIMAPVRLYRFTWCLNNHFKFDFRNAQANEITLKRKNRKYHFQVSTFVEINDTREHLLYSNQHDGEYLVPEMRNMDFLWLVKGELQSQAYITDLKRDLMTMNEVNMVYDIDPKSVKSIVNLVL